jgi:FkbM family methyltransferase
VTTKEVQSPRGVTVSLHARDGTSDLATIGSTFRLWGHLVDEYGLADIYSDGLLVDVGAHIGTVAIAFLIDNPKAHAVAVEPLPENVECIRKNAESAGVADRLTIIEGSIGTSVVHYGYDDHRYIGNIGGSTANTAIATEPVTLSAISVKHGDIDILKLDCEGCEWSALSDPVIHRVPLIVGEYHHRGPSSLGILTESHVVTADAGDTGNFRAVRR